MASASRGEMPNSAASKRSASYRKPPGLPVSSISGAHPRLVGMPEMASASPYTRSHSSSGEVTPPG